MTFKKLARAVPTAGLVALTAHRRGVGVRTAAGLATSRAGSNICSCSLV